MSRRGPRTSGAVYGDAGSGMVGSSWVANAGVAQVGRDGELRTAAILDGFASDGAAVMHNLRIPGSSANIDHVVVTGRRIILIDAKQWKPGRYWTVAGRTRRGWRRFAVEDRSGRRTFPADKKTMAMAADSVRSMLARAGVQAELPPTLTVVWSSSDRADVHLRLLRMHGTKAIAAKSLRRRVSRLMTRSPAAPDVVRALASLVNVEHDSPRTAALQHVASPDAAPDAPDPWPQPEPVALPHGVPGQDLRAQPASGPAGTDGAPAPSLTDIDWN